MYSIHQYKQEIEKIKHFGGSSNEGAIRRAFANLLNSYASKQNLVLVEELSVKNNKGDTLRFDGVLKDILRLDWGYWEAKDESDDLNEEIEKKFKKGYPNDNILFEDSLTAVLIQGGVEVMRVDMNDENRLDALLQSFVSYERPEVKGFRTAIELFKNDIPKVSVALRIQLEVQEQNNLNFKNMRNDFWELCKASINPSITAEDIREMIIQHILTEDIFNTIFDETQFHRENNIARELEKVIHTFFVKEVKRETLGQIQHYYLTIKAAAAGIADHHEKQKFLKVIYENFYKAYNPKGADRLGIVYTPNEIVKFMIESTDYLLYKHFDKYLEDKGVEILDPATGTGTYICDIIDYIRKEKLEYKYKHEIHANEVAILPYYIANLNIEYTYKQKVGKYIEFENLCFVDTLDNVGFSFLGKQTDMFGVSAENAERIKRQNERKISVIIGNPPYNANQQNENENNKNHEYKFIDKRIKDTYIKESTAQKTKVYDMYARFYRWASDRLAGNGMIAMITNRSFIESRTFDGFRKVVASEFDHIYIIDLGGDVRTNPKLSGTKHNVFGIQTGVAIMFLVKGKDNKMNVESEEEFEYLKKKLNLSVTDEPEIHYQGKIYYSPVGCRIFYLRRPEMETAAEKLQFLSQNSLQKLFKDGGFERIRADKNHNWVNLAEENDWETLLPVCSKEVKSGKSNEAIFGLFSLGVVTARDEWVFDENKAQLSKKVNFLINAYNKEVRKHKGKLPQEIERTLNYEIKWSRAVKKDLAKGRIYTFEKSKMIESLYRPFMKKYLYFAKELNEMQYQLPAIFGEEAQLRNNVININTNGNYLSYFSSNILSDLHFVGDNQCLPLYRYDKEGNRLENITDWALSQFRNYYSDNSITKQNIFHYVYAVLHNPSYRKKYELNLKRDFPRIPLYPDFEKWANWGKQLMNLHINYENVTPYPLIITQLEIEKGHSEKPQLKALKNNGEIQLTDYCTLSGIPIKAWDYILGNRSALEWVLDQYKESKPSDPTIAAHFHHYRFLAYKKVVIDLLMRVCTVSMETLNIMEDMRQQQ